jgi:hypothetical protein
MKLDPALYEKVVEDLADVKPVTDSEYQSTFTRQIAHALILAYLSTNASYITEPDPLWENRLLKRGNESCDSSSHFYTGTVERIHRSRFKSRFQLLASAGIMVWGLLLFAAALPYRGMVIHGKLNQWMSFGADIGLEDMVGASSGRAPAVSDRVWTLRINEVGVGEHTIGLEASNKKGSSEELRLRFGERYI